MINLASNVTDVNMEKHLHRPAMECKEIIKVLGSMLNNNFSTLTNCLTDAKLPPYRYHDKQEICEDLKKDIKVVLQVLVGSSFQV